MIIVVVLLTSLVLCLSAKLYAVQRERKHLEMENWFLRVLLDDMRERRQRVNTNTAYIIAGQPYVQYASTGRMFSRN